MSTVSILVAHAHPLMCRALRSLLQNQPDWEIVAEVSNGADALVHAKQIRPDIMILDIRLPRINGLDAARLLLQEQPDTKILILGDRVTEPVIAGAYQVGVQGYMTTLEAEKDLVGAVHTLLEGRVFITGEALDYWRHHAQRDPRENRHSLLSLRETEILQLLVEGSKNREIAAVLGISHRTVENHRSQIMQKLNVRNFSDLVRHAVRQGIIEP